MNDYIKYICIVCMTQVRYVFTFQVFMSCFASAQGNIIATVCNQIDIGYVLTLTKRFIFQISLYKQGCNDGYLKLWSFSEGGSKMTHCIQEVHDLGITCGDCDYSSSDCKLHALHLHVSVICPNHFYIGCFSI